MSRFAHHGKSFLCGYSGCIIVYECFLLIQENCEPGRQAQRNERYDSKPPYLLVFLLYGVARGGDCGGWVCLELRRIIVCDWVQNRTATKLSQRAWRGGGEGSSSSRREFGRSPFENKLEYDEYILMNARSFEVRWRFVWFYPPPPSSGR